MKKIYLFIPILLLVTLFSCEEKKGTTTVDTTQTKPMAINASSTLRTLRDSADKAWDKMIKSDDQKVDDLARLLQEISYCKKYNALLLDSLNEVVKTLKDKRYKQLTMLSPEIDQYDELTNLVISRVKYLARTTGELKSHPIAETLFNDIAAADNDVVRYRSLYDHFAMEYNDFLDKNKELLGENVNDFPKLPLFSVIVNA
ncbi:MAG TPA: hypothetical protein VNB90_13110 [Cytophagaceae bacterium]|nr:hypothetical protein [Cytophagaceae bacterium]